MDISRIIGMCWERKITIAELERNVGLANGSIGKWKQHNPRIDSVLKVANFFNCSVDDLLCNTQ